MTADPPDRLRPALAACASGALPANVALLRLAMAAEGPGEVEAALEGAGEAARRAGDAEAAGRFGAALALWRANPQAFATVKAVLDGVEHGGEADLKEGVARWAETFDRMAAASHEGAVALYALGNPDLLRAATEEVVARLRDWDLLGGRVLEVGCGIGRFVAALAPQAEHVTGLDISAAMIERARDRCAGLPNVALRLSSGQGLDGVADGSADLVLAADVFPYLVQAGLAARHVEEAARALRPGGHLLILNFSYRGDFGRDRDEVEALAARHGFSVRLAGPGNFTLWDATAFLLRRN